MCGCGLIIAPVQYAVVYWLLCLGRRKCVWVCVCVLFPRFVESMHCSSDRRRCLLLQCLQNHQLIQSLSAPVNAVLQICIKVEIHIQVFVLHQHTQSCDFYHFPSQFTEVQSELHSGVLRSPNMLSIPSTSLLLPSAQRWCC